MTDTIHIYGRNNMEETKTQRKHSAQSHTEAHRHRTMAQTAPTQRREAHTAGEQHRTSRERRREKGAEREASHLPSETARACLVR